MPRSLIRISLLFLMVAVLVSCGGPPKKPAPPEKTSEMEVAKGTTTTDMPEAGEPETVPEAAPETAPEMAPVAGEAEAPARPMTIDEYIDRMMHEKGVPRHDSRQAGGA